MFCFCEVTYFFVCGRYVRWDFFVWCIWDFGVSVVNKTGTDNFYEALAEKNMELNMFHHVTFI